MKPLELKVYKIWNSLGGAMYADNPNDPRMPFNVGYEVQRKRFSNAELAAEYHQQNGYTDLRTEGYKVGACGHALDPDERVEIGRLKTIHRFATLPHYDEQP